MTHPFVFGLVTGLVLGIISAVLSLLRGRGEPLAAALINFFGNIIVTGLWFTWPAYGFGRPVTTFAGLLPLFLGAVFLALVIAAIADGAGRGLSASPIAMSIVLVVVGITWIAVHNGPHNAHEAAYGIVHVTKEASDALPASSTSELVVLTPDQAATKASSAMSSGVAASRNFATYLDLGPATLQRVNGRMWYVFPLQFDGAGNKARLHGTEPGYIMIDAQNPNTPPVERYDGAYSMTVSLGGGQGTEPDRWARSHGYSGYLLDDPTLEIADSGLPGITPGAPYYTVTLLKPYLGTTFPAPVGMLLINARTGQITRYSLPGRGLKNPAPGWIDRIYGQDMAEQIANWYGEYGQAPWPGIGSSNANRFQVSGTPVLTYTGDENPSWRMLLTSFNAESSTYRIVEFDAATGAMRIYTPASPMGIETAVNQAFCNAQGVGAGQVKSNRLIPEHLSLHMIDGQLTWMVSYETEGAATQDDAPDQQAGDDSDPCGTGAAPVSRPTFTGIGFVSAYNATAANAVFGNSLNSALQNYLQQLAGQANSNGNGAAAGASQVTVTGTVCQVNTDTAGGNTTYYLTLCGADRKPDYAKVYTGTSGGNGPAIVLAQKGDDVTLRVLAVTAKASSQQIEGFSDQQHALAPAGG
jgi:hypothetical protein